MNRREFHKAAAGSLAIMATGAIPKIDPVEEELDQALEHTRATFLYIQDCPVESIVFCDLKESDPENKIGRALFGFQHPLVPPGQLVWHGHYLNPEFYPHERLKLQEIADRRGWKMSAPGYWSPLFS